MRLSPGRRALPLIIGLCVGDTALRGQPWAYEWRWANLQYAFVSIFLVPLVAGVAAWHGTVWSNWLALDPASVARGVRSCWIEVSALWWWVVVGYLCGYLVVVGIVKAHGTPAGPGWDAVGAAVPPLMLSLAAIGWGFAVGRAVRSIVVVPLVAMATFGAMIAGAVALPERVGRVGGATADLMGIRVLTSVRAGQAALFLAAAALAVALGASARLRWEDWHWRSIGAAAAALALSTAVVGNGQGYFAPTDPELSCVGRGPALCLAPGYVHLEPRLREVLQPSMEALLAADLPRPVRLTQVFREDAPTGDGYIAVALMLRWPETAGGYALTAFYRPGCADGSAERGRAFETMSEYIDGWTRGGSGPHVDVAERRRLHAAMRLMIRCKEEGP